MGFLISTFIFLKFMPFYTYVTDNRSISLTPCAVRDGLSSRHLPSYHPQFKVWFGVSVLATVMCVMQ